MPNINLTRRNVIIGVSTLPLFVPFAARSQGAATAIFLLEGVAGGVLGGIGSKLFNDAIQGQNIDEIIYDYIRQLPEILSSIIKENDLNDLTSRFRGMQNLLIEYYNTKDENRLNFLVNESSVLLSRLERFGVASLIIHAIAASFRLAIHVENINRFTGRAREGEKLNFRNTLNSSNQYYEKTKKKWIESILDLIISNTEGQKSWGYSFTGSISMPWNQSINGKQTVSYLLTPLVRQGEALQWLKNNGWSTGGGTIGWDGRPWIRYGKYLPPSPNLDSEIKNLRSDYEKFLRDRKSDFYNFLDKKCDEDTYRSILFAQNEWSNALNSVDAPNQ